MLPWCNFTMASCYHGVVLLMEVAEVIRFTGPGYLVKPLALSAPLHHLIQASHVLLTVTTTQQVVPGVRAVVSTIQTHSCEQQEQYARLLFVAVKRGGGKSYLEKC